MRLVFLAGTFAVFAAAATFACSSATPASNATDAGVKGAGGNVNTGTPGSSGNTTTPPATTTPPVTTDPGDGGIVDATTPPTTGPQQNSDAGAACAPTSFGEVEPNNDAASANALTVPAFDATTGRALLAFCGTVGNGDTDFISFTMPVGTRAYEVVPNTTGGNVDISGTIGGQDFDLQDGFPGGVQGGDKWVVQFQTGSTNLRSYNVRFQFCSQQGDPCDLQ